MKKKPKRVQIWVDPEFKRVVAIKSKFLGKTQEEVTKDYAEMEDISKYFENEKKKFKFKI